VSVRDALRELNRAIAEDYPDLQDILADALRHPSRSVRAFAAVNLATLFQDVRAASVLAETLQVGDTDELRAAANALWEIGDADAPGLLNMLAHAPIAERDAVANALYWVGWAPDDPDSAVAFFRATHQWRACIALGPDAVPGLVKSLSDWDGAVRRGAAWVLGEIGDARAVPWLAELLSDPTGDLFGEGGRICDIAAEALEKIGTAEAWEALQAWRGV
jgi:HEAT repeat protein